MYDLELEGEIEEEIEKKFNFKDDINEIVKEFGDTVNGEDLFKIATDRLREDFGTTSPKGENEPTFFEKIAKFRQEMLRFKNTH